jgi:hypothetical protein
MMVPHLLLVCQGLDHQAVSMDGCMARKSLKVTRLFLRREDAEWNIVEGEVAVCINMQEGSHVTGE